MQQQSVVTSSGFQTHDRIAFIQAGWHRDIVDQCRLSFISEIGKLGYVESDIDFFQVPGAFEIPLQAKLMANSGKYAAIVAAGFVVNGGIYRHEFVADAVISGLMQVQLATEVPVLSVVLTPHHFHASEEHQHFFHDHFRIKGAEAAHVCAATIRSLRELKAPIDKIRSTIQSQSLLNA